MAEIVTIGQDGTLSGTVYGTTDTDEASLPLVPPQLAAYTKQSQEDLFVSVSAGLATKYTATASCWRDFDVEKSSSGNSGETIQFTLDVNYAWKLHSFLGSSSIDYWMELFDVTNGVQKMESVHFVSASESGGKPQQQSQTETVEINEFVEAGRTYRLRFDAQAIGSAATTDSASVFANGTSDSATNESAGLLQGYDGHCKPPAEWSYTWLI